MDFYKIDAYFLYNLRDKLGLIQNGMQHFVSVSCLVQGGSTLSHLLLNDQINIFAFFDHSILMAWLSINLLKRNQRHIKYFVKYLEHPSFVVGQVNPGEKSGHISDEHV